MKEKRGTTMKTMKKTYERPTLSAVGSFARKTGVLFRGPKDIIARARLS
jgi:uncharacterized protein DUF5972